MSAILAIDPGTTHSGWVLMRNGKLWNFGVDENNEVLAIIKANPVPVAIERLSSYGMPVGREVYETCEWVGRFQQAAGADRVRLIYRRDIRHHLCGGNPKANDATVWQTMLDRFGPGKALAVGTMKRPGPLFGLKSHARAALAVAVTAAETRP